MGESETSQLTVVLTRRRGRHEPATPVETTPFVGPSALPEGGKVRLSGPQKTLSPLPPTFLKTEQQRNPPQKNGGVVQ